MKNITYLNTINTKQLLSIHFISCFSKWHFLSQVFLPSWGAIMVVIVWLLDLQLLMQSVPVITNVWISVLARCTRYNIMW